MKLHLICSVVRVLSIAASLAWASAATRSHAAVSLMSVDPTGTNTTSAVTAMTPDGEYVTGNSGSSGLLWTAGTNSVAHVQAGNTARLLNGAGYRTVGGNKVLTLFGMNTQATPRATSWSYDFVAGTWQAFVSTSTYTQTTLTNNLLGSQEGTDIFYVGFKPSTSTPGARLARGNLGTGTLTWKDGDGGSSSVQGASASGRIIGKRQVSGFNFACYWTWTTGANPQPVADILGLAGSTGDEGYSIDVAGDTFAGTSVVGGVITPWISNNPGSNATALPLLAGAGTSVPQGMSPDGNYLVGRNFVGGLERAVLWDISDPDSSNWTVTDLTDLATSLGILNGFSALNRAISFGVNGAGEFVIAGNGTWARDINAARFRAGSARAGEYPVAGIWSTGTAPAPPLIRDRSGLL